MFSQLLSAGSSVLADLLSQSARRVGEFCGPWPAQRFPERPGRKLLPVIPRAVSHNLHVVSPLFSCIVLHAEKLGANGRKTLPFWAQIEEWLVSKGSRINVNFAECW
jgi:hypothetical protein